MLGVDVKINEHLRLVLEGRAQVEVAHAHPPRRGERAGERAVDEGVETAACDALIESWRVCVTRGFPLVVMKVAMTLDGRIATRTGASPSGDDAVASASATGASRPSVHCRRRPVNRRSMPPIV